MEVCTIPFEIRDLKYDLSALQTIPQVYGIQKTKFLAILSLIIFLIFSFHLHYENSVIFFSELMVSMFVACLVIFSEKQQKHQDMHKNISENKTKITCQKSPTLHHTITFIGLHFGGQNRPKWHPKRVKI